MDDEQRAALAALNETIAAGFVRMEHYFDAQNTLMRERLDELQSDNELRRRTGELSNRVLRLEQAVDPPRELVRDETADMRLELFEIRWKAWPIQHLRREIAALTARVDRLQGYTPTDPAVQALRR
jgi:hypothetical protein